MMQRGMNGGMGVTGAGTSAAAARRAEEVPLLAPTPIHPSLSRSSSTASNASSSGRGILRRIFIDRVATPSQHLLRPTFPPVSLTTYEPAPHTPLSRWERVRLNVTQAFSLAISTVFLAGVVVWALSVEFLQAIPKYLKPTPEAKYDWDRDAYWRKEGVKISKEPRDYARQIGMDIENQTVETEDGYYLRCVRCACAAM